jgi:Cu(I)/Ag(I) efflux system membrane protein CusA/SilA
LGYNLSVASIAGIVATLGIAAEMLIIMIIYIKNSLEDKIFEGAVKRVRAKLITGIVIISSLLPILHSQEMGSEIISKIVAPMIGGTISSLITALLFIPPLYLLIYKMKNIKLKI